jgi:hypothetical protein
MVGFGRVRCWIVLVAVTAGAGLEGGCKSSPGARDGAVGGGGNGGSGAAGGLFTDPAVPRCTGSSNVELRGMLDGQSVNDATTLASNLSASAYQSLEVVGGAVRQNIVLTWSDPLAEDVAIPLTGESLIMREGQPFATQPFCITAGEFGSPSLTAGAAGRTLLFRITGAQRGACADDGPVVPVALAGCDFRTNTFFPVANQDGAAGDAADARDAAPSQCPAITPPDAAASCNSIEYSGDWIEQEVMRGPDGGVTGDGGVLEEPAGGTLVDGDYVLVRHRASGGSGESKRTLRLLAGATRMEWAIVIMNGTVQTEFRYNLNLTRSGNGLDVASATCTSGSALMTTRYDFTASGDRLSLFTIDSATGLSYNIYEYRRVCPR